MGEPNDNLMESLKVYSATKYAKTRAEVEKEINERWSTPEEKSPEKPAEAPRSDSNASGGFLDGWLNRKP
jgi:hypothetical protein